MLASVARERELEQDCSIVISRVFDAPREMVFDAWSDPKQIVLWWGPEGFTTTIEEMDFREGGRWIHVMHGPDGTNYPNHHVFTKIVRPELIAHRHGGGVEGQPDDVEFEAIAEFEDLGKGRTRLTMTMVFPSNEDRDRVAMNYGAVEGGRQTLARLAEFLHTKELRV